MSDEQKDFTIEIRFKGNLLDLSGLLRTHTVGYLKSLIYEQTSISPENQKLIGLKALQGGILDDSCTFEEIILPSNSKIILMGSTQDEIKGINAISNRPDSVVNDLDSKKIKMEISKNPLYLNKVAKRIRDYKVTEIEKPRQESKLLVLDIDYTIFDHRSPAQNVRELMRPYLHDFLRQVYPKYDIAIWSATGMTWIKTKLYEMGLISRSVSQHLLSSTDPVSREPDEEVNALFPDIGFKISLVLDQGAMISVEYADEGVKEVKPLNVIWANYPQWGPQNTIMFDDIQRNFDMNPASGLRIKPYKHAYRAKETDRELLELADYLELISQLDFRTLRHKYWRKYKADNDAANPAKRTKVDK